MPDAVERGSGAFRRGLRVQAQVERAECHVFQHGGHEELAVGILKHHPDLAADGRQVTLFDGHSADGDAAPAIAAFGPQQSVQVHREGGLTTAVGP